MNELQFQRAAGINSELATRWYPYIISTITEFDISTPIRQAAFIAQIGTESLSFSQLSESFNYSIAALTMIFPRRITTEQALSLGRHSGETSVPKNRQVSIANLVYANRYGNSLPGDGYKFRGRGLKQITFKANYWQCGRDLGVDLINDPDLLLQDKYAARSAGWFWKANNCNTFADSGDFVGLTKRINGGINGLADRKLRYERACKVLL